MKNLKSVILLLTIASAPLFLFANGEKKKTETITIQTSAMCESCEQRIESAVNNLKGIKEASLNLDDKKITVTYFPAKVSAEDIKSAIVKAGYDADEMQCDTDAYSKLPGCCKKDGGHH